MSYQPNVISFERPVKSLGKVDWRGGVILRSTNWLGDLLMTLPATWQLKKALPVDVPLWVASPAGLAPLWQAASWVDGVIPFTGKRLDEAARVEVRRQDFGLGIVLPNSFGSAMDFWRCGIPRRLGRCGNLRGLLLTDRIPQWRAHEGEGAWHQLSWYLELMRPVGAVECSAECPKLDVDDALAAEHGIVKGAGWVALAPGAAYGPAKQWPEMNYAVVAREVLKRGGKVVLVGTEKEGSLTSMIAQEAPGALDLAGKTKLPALMSVLANVDAVVANDSGSMHLAAAVGTPGVGIFASTDPIATGPLGAPWELEVADVDCRPCLQRICPWAGSRQYQCMRCLTPERILASLWKVGKK
ncbi:MAG: lipopolysaccharide heptosyltransferase II [Lentisphaeria bacterium]|nr:lipopolysaccharide heptosyltransferase II [Lentisphaeria bacterium]